MFGGWHRSRDPLGDQRELRLRLRVLAAGRWPSPHGEGIEGSGFSGSWGVEFQNIEFRGLPLT